MAHVCTRYSTLEDKPGELGLSRDIVALIKNYPRLAEQKLLKVFPFACHTAFNRIFVSLVLFHYVYCLLSSLRRPSLWSNKQYLHIKKVVTKRQTPSDFVDTEEAERRCVPFFHHFLRIWYKDLAGRIRLDVAFRKRTATILCVLPLRLYGMSPCMR